MQCGSSACCIRSSPSMNRRIATPKALKLLDSRADPLRAESDNTKISGRFHTGWTHSGLSGGPQLQEHLQDCPVDYGYGAVSKFASDRVVPTSERVISSGCGRMGRGAR